MIHEEIVEMGFPIFCRGCSIRGTAKSVLGLINHPTVFGGMIIHSGDLILGDDDGIVIVDRKECAAVLEKSIERKHAEGKKAEQLKAGVSSVELNKLEKIFTTLGLLED